MDAETRALRDELNAALADLEEAGSMSEIATVLAEMLEMLKTHKSEAPVVNVTNQVSPTPITNVVNVQPCAARFHGFVYDAKNRLVDFTMTPMKKAG